MNRSLLLTIALLAVLAFVTLSVLPSPSHAQAANSAPDATRARTVGLTRSLNTAEYAYRHSVGHFGSLYDLFSVNYISHTDRDLANPFLVRSDDIVPNLTAVAISNPDKDAYALAVYDTVAADHGYAVFSDQAGVIYQGQPLTMLDSAHLADINLVRAINTAEITYKSKYGHCADFDTLVAQGLVKQFNDANVTFAKSPDVLPDLQAIVTVPPSQDTWLVAVHDKSTAGGPFSVFSDPSGIIYPAAPLK